MVFTEGEGNATQKVNRYGIANATAENSVLFWGRVLNQAEVNLVDVCRLNCQVKGSCGMDTQAVKPIAVGKV